MAEVVVSRVHTRREHRVLWPICAVQTVEDKAHIKSVYIDTGLIVINRTISGDHMELSYDIVAKDQEAWDLFNNDPIIVAIRQRASERSLTHRYPDPFRG